jgi:NADH-quinone oxidoreductase subunit L
MTHAFFKALLFLGSGSVIHGMHHEQDMRRMGNLKKYMPITFFTMVTGWLAIAGIPIFAGFFSKDEILYKTFAADKYFPAGTFPGNEVLWAVAVGTAVLTAIYMTRMMVMTFWGTERFHEALPDASHPDDAAHAEENAFAMGDAHDDEMQHGSVVRDAHDDEDDHHHALPADFKPHESPWVMTVPLIILAVLSTVGGLVGVPYAISSLVGIKDANKFEHVLEPVIAETRMETAVAAREAAKSHAPDVVQKERLLALLSILMAAGGIAIGWFVFRNNPLRRMPKILEQKWRVDEFYNGYIVDPITDLSRTGLWKGFDLGFIDGIVHGIGGFVRGMGSAVRGIQVGFVRSYAAVIILGAVIVVAYFVYFGMKLI